MWIKRVGAVSAAGLAFLAGHEALRTEAYPDPGYGWQIPTICYGYTAEVRRGDVATPEQCWSMLESEAASYAAHVTKQVKVPMTQGMLDAATSFTYNVGKTAFSRSTLLRKWNAGDYCGAKAEFLRWDKSNGKRLRGLTKRRIAEAELFGRGITC